MTTQILSNPVIQYGFAGLCLILLGFLAWLVKRLLGVLEQTTAVIKDNTQIIGTLKEESDEVRTILGDVRDRLLARPCIAKGK